MVEGLFLLLELKAYVGSRYPNDDGQPWMAQATWVRLASSWQSKPDSEGSQADKAQGEAIWSKKFTRRGTSCAPESKEEERNGKTS